MSTTSQFLTFEIHLTDAALVAQLQAAPPGETSTQHPTSGPLTGTAVAAIIRAPHNAGPPPGGASVEFGTAAVPVLPMIGPGQPIVAPCLYSEWFTSTNNFPRDVATFVRKSGGWFGIPEIFGDKTRFFWRGVFVYTPPLTPEVPGNPGTTRASLAPRRWVDGFLPVWSERHLVDSQGGAAGGEQSRSAGRTVEGGGWAIRGTVGVRTHYLMGYLGGAAISTGRKSWERLYWRLDRAPAASVTIWRAFAATTGEVLNGCALQIAPSGQIGVYGVSNIGVYTLWGSTPPLTLGREYKVDILVCFGDPAYVQVYLNGVQAISVAGTVVQTLMGGVTTVHQKSALGLELVDPALELNVSFWMNADLPTNGPVDVTPRLDGLDFLNGSRAMLVRASGFAAAHADWTGDWRLLAQTPPLQNSATNVLSTTTASAYLAVTTDAEATVDAMPNALGAVAFIVHLYGHRGTTHGQLGYKIGSAPAHLEAIVQSDFAAASNGTWNSVLFSTGGVELPTPITPLELHHLKGADGTISRVVHLAATVEVIGTFGEEDFGPDLPATLRFPLPFLGIHNAPYPFTPWARTASPALAPVVIKSGTYIGNSIGQDLLFRIPMHWVWIRRLSTTPKGVRWWSSRLAAGLGLERATFSSVMPQQGMNTAFDTTPVASDPTGVGALPDRSAQVAAFVAANSSLLDGDEGHRRDLLGMICRELNLTNPGDGNNWGLLTKNDRTPPFIPSDILVWNPTLEHVDVLTDTAATWLVIGVIPPEWSWTKMSPEGQQEMQAFVRIAGADAESNLSPEVYHYLAVGDPASRFMLNGALALHPSGVTLPATHALAAAGFTADAGFFGEDRGGVENAGTDTLKRMAYKGPANAAAAATLLAGTEITPAVTFGAGTLTVNTGAFSLADGRLAFSLFRRDDGSADPGRKRVVQIVSYIGNGDATRGIALTPASERYPLFAIIAPNTPSTAYYKDPQHTGGNSTAMDNGSQITTAIKTGGIDLISVGATLNVLGTPYNVFVIVGGLEAGADGFSIDGEFIPVAPDSFGDIPDDPVPGDDDDDGDGGGTPAGGAEPPGDPAGTPCGGVDGMDCDLTTACAPLTTRLVNIALSRIGISRQVTTLANPVDVAAWDALANYVVGDLALSGGIVYRARTNHINFLPPNATHWTPQPAPDVSEEATLARLHYAKDVEATLRDFPWPFATRYAALTLIAGSPSAPVNSDWTYSYRRPADCVFERRLAVARSGAVNPTPPPFQLSYDDTGGRILTNQATARLEYTARPPCVAGRGDPLFLEALIWKLASSFAGPLTRMPDVIKHAADQYGAAIAKAEAVIRPGNPGARTTVDPAGLDVLPGCAAANVSVVNRALIRIGARTIANLDTEQSREADAARVIFEDELKATLRDFPWAFATKYASTLTRVAGTPTVPANLDWIYSYRYPSDAVFIRRLVTVGVGRAFDPAPANFRAGNDTTGGLLYTDVVNPTIEYTARIPCAVGRADALFRDAFAWRLAACLAASLAQVDPDAIEQQGRGPQERPRERKATEAQLRARAADAAWRMYARTLEQARMAEAREAQQPPGGDAEWIRGRD